jgi:hypothetical protein
MTDSTAHVPDLLGALSIARDAIEANDQWHRDYDDYDGYEGSELQVHNQAALICVDRALARVPPPLGDGFASLRAERDDYRARLATQCGETLAARAAVARRAEPTNDQIRAVFLAHGFTIKPGHDDLKPYVYEAARALLAEGGESGKC